jgi:hypothetical protein
MAAETSTALADFDGTKPLARQLRRDRTSRLLSERIAGFRSPTLQTGVLSGFRVNCHLEAIGLFNGQTSGLGTTVAFFEGF